MYIYIYAAIHFKGLQKFVGNYKSVIEEQPYSVSDYLNSWFSHVPKVRPNSFFFFFSPLFHTNRKRVRKP